MPLPEALSWHIEEYMGGRAGFAKAEMICALNNMVQEPGHFGATSEEIAEGKNEATRFMKELVEWFDCLTKMWEWGEEQERKVYLQQSLLPSTADCERIQRYESHLNRIFMQSLHELQRIQAARKSGIPPVSASLDVTLNTDVSH